MFVVRFTRFERHLGDTIDSEGWSKFYVFYIFYTLWVTSGRYNRLRGMGKILHLYCVLHALSDIWATQSKTLRLYCVLHASSDIWATQSTPRDGLSSTFVLCFARFERRLGYTIDSEGWAKFYVCIVFYILWATQSTPRDWLTSTFEVCFTRFERHLGDMTDSEIYAKFYVSIAFYTLWATSGRHN